MRAIDVRTAAADIWRRFDRIGYGLCLAFFVPQTPPAVMAQDMEKIETVIGVRETKGNAVECPRLRTDDGRSVFIFRLPPTIGIGTRIKVTGVFVNPTTCMGPALRADEIQIL